MKLLKKFILLGLIGASLIGCNKSSTNFISPESTLTNSFDESYEANAIQQKGNPNKYLCVTLPTGGDSEIVKVLNLQTKELISLPVPGAVQGMASDLANNIIYVNAKSAEGNAYSLYKLDIKAKQISRILSFSQLGIKPT